MSDDYNEELNRLLAQAKFITEWRWIDRDMVIMCLLDLVEILCKQHEGIDTVQIASEIASVLEQRMLKQKKEEGRG